MTNFDPEQWGKIKELFLLALDQTPEAQRQVIESSTNDPAVRKEVARLLLHHALSSGFLKAPLIEGDKCSDLSPDDLFNRRIH